MVPGVFVAMGAVASQLECGCGTTRNISKPSSALSVLDTPNKEITENGESDVVLEGEQCEVTQGEAGTTHKVSSINGEDVKTEALHKELADAREETKRLNVELSKERERSAESSAREQGALLRLENARVAAREARQKETEAVQKEKVAKAQPEAAQSTFKDSIVDSLLSPRAVRATENWLQEDDEQKNTVHNEANDEIEKLKAEIAENAKAAEDAKHALKTHRAWSHRALASAKEEAQNSVAQSEEIAEKAKAAEEKAAQQASELEVLKAQLVVLQVQKKHAETTAAQMKQRLALAEPFLDDTCFGDTSFSPTIQKAEEMVSPAARKRSQTTTSTKTSSKDRLPPEPRLPNDVSSIPLPGGARGSSAGRLHRTHAKV